jgi:hypothetical protein
LLNHNYRQPIKSDPSDSNRPRIEIWCQYLKTYILSFSTFILAQDYFSSKSEC